MKASRGFTLLEGVITLTVVVVLMAIALPAYHSYTRRTYYKEVLKAIEPYKASVITCYNSKKKLSACNAGSNKIPAAIKTNTGSIASLSVNAGVITVVPVAQNGIQVTDTYILTPTISKNTVTWTTSGGAVNNRYAK
jgi:prepilin-type N-terminal cleavage/methylation domain-containing protein